MNILVTGANGQLGHEMQICAQKSNHKFVFTDVAEGYENWIPLILMLFALRLRKMIFR